MVLHQLPAMMITVTSMTQKLSTVMHIAIEGCWQLGREQTQVSFFRFGPTAVKTLAINSLVGNPATSSFGFNVTVDVQVGQSSFFPSPSTFSSSCVVKFSRQALQNEWEQGKIFGSLMVFLQTSQMRRFWISVIERVTVKEAAIKLYNDLHRKMTTCTSADCVDLLYFESCQSRHILLISILHLHP